MFQVSILIIGASTALLSLAKGYKALVFYAITFGFFDGCFVGQVAVVTSHIVGMKHLAVALGYLFGSIALPMTLGPPVAGWIFDGWQSYNIAFYVAGSTSFLGFLTMFLIPRLVKKYAEHWEKQFDFKRRASIESRRKLLSLSEYGPETSQTLGRNSFYETDVFSNTETGVPLTQISVERPNFTRGRRRSLPALYISNTPSPNLRNNAPGKQNIARLSAELSGVTQYVGVDDQTSPAIDSRFPASVSRPGTNLATEKPRPNRMRGRRGSLPVISHKSGFQGNASQTEVKMPRMAQVLLVDANLLAQQGIPLVSVNVPPKFNRNKRRGSLPAVNYPNLPTVTKAPRPRTYDLGRRRGSLPTVSVTIPEACHDSENRQKLNSNGLAEKNRKPIVLPSRGSREEAIDEREEEVHEGHQSTVVDNLETERLRLESTSSGYSTNGNIDGSAGSRTSWLNPKESGSTRPTFSGNELTV